MSRSDARAGIKLGVSVFVTDEGLRPDELAACVEQHGFESLFITEHTHIPASRESHYLAEGGELRREYSRTLDPFVALTAAAAATSRLRLATGVCLLAQRDPIMRGFPRGLIGQKILRRGLNEPATETSCSFCFLRCQ